VTEIISNCNVGELDIFAKTDIDPSVATYFWKLRVDSKGATDLYVVRNTFQPGASTGWHTHPGPSLITVVSGTITAYDSNCTPTVYGPGAAAGAYFIDIGGGEVHLLRNEGTVEAVTVAVHLSPRAFLEGSTRQTQVAQVLTRNLPALSCSACVVAAAEAREAATQCPGYSDT
jgi:quercetin dioxygenase-like cupin family protein